jgi:hypothetical protein
MKLCFAFQTAFHIKAGHYEKPWYEGIPLTGATRKRIGFFDSRVLDRQIFINLGEIIADRLVTCNGEKRKSCGLDGGESSPLAKRPTIGWSF